MQTLVIIHRPCSPLVGLGIITARVSYDGNRASEVPLQGRQGSRGCIPGSPGESGLVSRGSQGVEPAGLCGRCTGVAVPLRVVPSPTGLTSPGDLLDPGIKPGSPALQEDSLPSEPPGKPSKY